MQISTGFLDIVFTEKDLHMALYNGYILFFLWNFSCSSFSSNSFLFFKGWVSFVSTV